MRLVPNRHSIIGIFSPNVHYCQGTDGSLAVVTLLDGKIDADLNYYDPDILLHIENCGRSNISITIDNNAFCD